MAQWPPPLNTPLIAEYSFSFLLDDKLHEISFKNKHAWAGAPRARRGPGVRLNIGQFRFCAHQKQSGKCQFSPNFDVVSEKKKERSSRQNASIFFEFLCVLQKKVLPTHKLVCHCHFNGPPEVLGPSDGPLKPMGPLNFMGSGVFSPLPPHLGGPVDG